MGQVVTAAAAATAIAGMIATATVAALNQPTAEPAAVLSPTPTVAPVATKPITPQATLAVLTELLPAGGSVSSPKAALSAR